MRTLIFILLLMPVLVNSQVIATRTNGLTLASERYVTNSPGNLITNSRVVERLQDSIAWAMSADSVIIRSVRNSLDHGTPVNVLFPNADGLLRTCPVANIPIVNSQIASLAWSKLTSTPTTLSGYGITDATSNARTALSLTTTGSGAAAYNNSTGVLNVPTPAAAPGNNNAAGYGTGTAYALTTSSAKITMGTTSPSITIPAAGTYLIVSNVTIDYSGLTTLAVAAANFKIRRTNNTAADIANTSTNFNIPIVTLLTATGGDADINAVIYTTANNNDVLELWGSRGAVTVGAINITNGYMVAVRIY